MNFPTSGDDTPENKAYSPIPGHPGKIDQRRLPFSLSSSESAMPKPFERAITRRTMMGQTYGAALAGLSAGLIVTSTPGASTLAVSRGDGIDWAYTVNTRDWPPSTSPTLDDLGNSITHLLDTIPIP